MSISKNAYIITNDQTIKGDSIWYNRKIGIGKAMKNVKLIDTTQDITILGDLAIHYEFLDQSMVTGNALLYRPFKKTLFFFMLIP